MRKMKTQTLVLSALLMAMHVVLSIWSVNLPFVKINLSGLPIILGGLLFGPFVGGLVGTLGSFLYQILAYGLMWTTIFWIIPVGVRGFLVGLYAKKKNFKLKGYEIMLLIVITSIIVTILNTFGLYWSGILNNFTETIWVVIWPRLISSVGTSMVYTVVTIPLFRLLRNCLKY